MITGVPRGLPDIRAMAPLNMTAGKAAKPFTSTGTFTMSIEEIPLELTEEQAEALWNFSNEVERLFRSSTALGILMVIARHTLLAGECRVSHKAFGLRHGKCRRSIDVAIKMLKRHRLIDVVGRDDRGAAIYRANFDALAGGADAVA